MWKVRQPWTIEMKHHAFIWIARRRFVYTQHRGNCSCLRVSSFVRFFNRKTIRTWTASWVGYESGKDRIWGQTGWNVSIFHFFRPDKWENKFCTKLLVIHHRGSILPLPPNEKPWKNCRWIQSNNDFVGSLGGCASYFPNACGALKLLI